MLTIAQYMEMAVNTIIDLVENEGWNFNKASDYTLQQFTEDQIPDNYLEEVSHTAYREIYW